ncbi:helix-turn-helix transcriptional regulator [Aeromonas sp. 25-281]|uniref:helix-turn-helix transcriptional regulator n=1 Tax=Aeromonas hydrophila TaxID=644 RepID=UPI001655073E|nr:AlpA family transcriptional regulator [Aeromonas hydrophila]MBC8671928.1 AlpA family transcriptional regulator [Aeromonas hydrophila]MBC8689776.1 AlpA family transcriptional regulator [Aeromonas hydrophila]
MKLIKLKDVTEMTTLSKATIYRLIKQGAFPRQIPLGPRAVAWRLSDVVTWIEQRSLSSFVSM